MRGARGFTLLEVLLAFLVFSLSFAAVLQILSGSIRNTVRAQQTTEVALIAQSVMDNVGIDIPLEDGSVAEGEEGIYRWEVEIYAFDGGQVAAEEGALQITDVEGISLLKVDLFVNWGEGIRERSQYFSTVKAVMANQFRP
jgi:general secretion pathway protein I